MLQRRPQITPGAWCVGSCTWEAWSLPSGTSQLIALGAGKVRWRIRVIHSISSLAYPGAKPAIISSAGRHGPGKVCPTTQQAGPDAKATSRPRKRSLLLQDSCCSSRWQGRDPVSLFPGRWCCTAEQELWWQLRSAKGLQWDSCHAAGREASLSVGKEEHFEVKTSVRTLEN